MPHTVLYVEDHNLVASTVRVTLEAEGWRVVLCPDGVVALRRLASAARYDLLLTDNHLPDVNGLELVRYARGLPHRARLPVVMFAARDCSRIAYRAGVDAFLKRPEDTSMLVSTIAQFLSRGA